jgi:2-iminobutanoate/2-iminopropanoate deaminase
MIHQSHLVLVLIALSSSCVTYEPSTHAFPVRSNSAPAALGPYTQAKAVPLTTPASLLFLSGQIGIDPATGKFAEGGITPETKQVLKNLRAVLEAGGSGLGSVLSVTVYLKDMADYEAFNRVYAESFTDIPPARTCVQVSSLPKGARVEMSCIALGR